MYLLQLVQALKFESVPADPARVPPARSPSSQHALQNQDSGLADFLVSRGAQNQVLGIRLHWYLMVEMENKATAKTYGRVAYKYMSKLMEVSKLCYALAHTADLPDRCSNRTVLVNEIF